MSDDNGENYRKRSRQIQGLPTDIAEAVASTRRTLRLSDQQFEADSPGTESEPPAATVSTIVEAIIGLGLMVVGLSTLVVVSLLPNRAGSWIFNVAALIGLLAGAKKIDQATRQYRKSRSRVDRDKA